MAGLLDFLGFGGGQQPMQAQTSQPQQQGGLFSGRLGILNDPTVALPLAGALMQPGDMGSNLGQGFALAGQGMDARRKLQMERAQQNATASWLESQGADTGLVELAKSGAGAQALQMWQASKKDPMNELNLTKAQLEIENLRNPRDKYISAGDGNMFNTTDGSFLQGPAGGGDYAKRQAAAAQLGLKPDDPAYQSFVLTGKMPREDQGPLTAVDKKAILEADEAVQANEAVINSLKSVITGEKGKTLNDRAGYGSSASTQSWLARNDPTGFFDDAKGEATTEFNNVVMGQALSSMKSIFGGNPTEGERAVLIDLQASVDKTPEERKLIIDRGIKLAEKRLEFNRERAAEMRGGTFYKSQGRGITPPSGNATSSGIQWSVEQ